MKPRAVRQHLPRATVRNGQSWKPQPVGAGLQGKSCYLLVLLGAMPEAWWHLVHLWMKGSPKSRHRCGSVKHSDLSSLLPQKPGSTYLLFFKMQTQGSKTSQSQKKAPCLEIKSLLPRIQSSQTSELDAILLLRKMRWSASQLGFSSWYRQAHGAEVYRLCHSPPMASNRTNFSPGPLLAGCVGRQMPGQVEGNCYSTPPPLA